MVVVILEKSPSSLRGELSRWLFEVKAGVFVGCISSLVRDELWKVITERRRQGNAMLIYPTNNEQGFTTRTLGKPRRTLQDIDGLLLVKT
jgi:CRISPR-associated protein Cas2